MRAQPDIGDEDKDVLMFTAVPCLSLLSQKVLLTSIGGCGLCSRKENHPSAEQQRLDCWFGVHGWYQLTPFVLEFLPTKR